MSSGDARASVGGFFFWLMVGPGIANWTGLQRRLKILLPYCYRTTRRVYRRVQKSLGVIHLVDPRVVELRGWSKKMIKENIPT